MKTLRLFIEVAKLRSFSQAAETQGITQSAASQRVRQLEDRLGVTLLDRSVRPLALTAEGEVFLRGCREVLERYEQLEQRVTQLKGRDLSGSVRIDSIYSAGIDWLRDIREGFETEHPQITVAINYKRPDEIHDSVMHGRCDVGIVSYPERWRGGGSMLLREEAMVVICNPGHPLAGREPIHASELARHRMASFELSLPVGRRVQRYLRDHGVTEPFVNVIDNIDTLKAAVAVTQQVAIVPRRAAMREVAAGTLAMVDLHPSLRRPIGIIYSRRGRGGGASFSPATKAFVDFLLAHASDETEKVDESAAEGMAVSRQQS